MTQRYLKLFSAIAMIAFTTACVAKQKYVDLQSELQLSQQDLANTKKSLDALQGLKPELEAKDAALKSTSEELDKARARMAELDDAQKKMEESLKSEIDDKTIAIKKLKDHLTVTFVDKILFDSGSDQIKPKGKESLKKVADSLKQMTSHKVQVLGHTDNLNLGGETKKRFPTNWELSTARATAVVRFLQDAGGLEPTRLYAVGCSYFHPIADNATPDGRSQNRRVEIVLTPIPADELNDAAQQSVPTAVSTTTATTPVTSTTTVPAPPANP